VKEGIRLYIALSDIALIILFLLATTVSVYLILVLSQAFKVFCRIRGILSTQDTAIQQSLAQLPGLLANLNALTLSLKQSADMANNTLDSWQTEVAGTVDDLRDGLETITLYSRAIGEVVKAVFSK
jgi:hypothetical protein